MNIEKNFSIFNQQKTKKSVETLSTILLCNYKTHRYNV